jgi:uncharacterized protein (TIGR03790 family)
MRRALVWMMGIGLTACAGAWAGGGPLHTLVIVNDNSALSQELGQYYQDARGLPERQVVHVRTTTNYTTDRATFTNEVVKPVLDYIAAAGLSNQIDVLVLTRDLPYRVTVGSVANGSSAVLFYGFRTNGPPCSISSAARSDYFATETAFTHADGPSSNRYYLSSVLTGYDLDQARRTVDRAVLADGSFPTGRVALLHTEDEFRSVRWTQFDEVLFAAAFRGQGILPEALDLDALSSTSNLFGYLTGVATDPFPGTLGFVRGALADHLTSYGGFLFDPAGQMSILEWLRQGVAGSYGTVVEPCNYTEKYPHALLHEWYARGFSLGESYTMALSHPAEGVIVGDPLTAPYARPPALTVSGLVAGAVVTGDVALTISASTTGLAGRVSRLDAALDGRWLGVVTNRPPTPGNTVSVTMLSTTCTATVQSGDTLEQVAVRLAAAVTNAALGFSARASGDRVTIVQQAAGVSGAWMQVSAASGTGVASYATVFARSVFTNFIESPVAAKEGLLLSGTPVTGDVLRTEVTRLDGVVVTNEAVATAGDTAATLIAKLETAINAEPALSNASGCQAKWSTHLAADKELWLVARTNGWQGRNLLVTYSILTNVGSTLTTAYGFTDNFDDNEDVLAARATVFLTEGETNLQATWNLAVTNLPDGPHIVEFVAYEGSAVRVQGRARIPFVVDRHNLTCAITNLVNGRHVLRGGAITAAVESVSPGVVTQVVLRVEGKEAGVVLTPPYQVVWPTTNYGAGVLGLQAQAWDDGGRSTVSDEVQLQLYTDDDGDALPDQWEYRALGSATNGTASGNPDGDAADNRAEFWADTDPRDVASEPELQRIRLEASPVLEFPVSSNRYFAVEANEGVLAGGVWVVVTNLPLSTGVVTWVETATNGLRFYRARASLP